MITRQTLLIYNFGIALTFVVAGLLSLLTFERFLDRPTIQPPFDPASMVAIKEESDPERLRQRAAFYFDLGRELKRARYADTDTLVRDFRLLCFLIGGILALGGGMSMVVTRSAPSEKVVSPPIA